MELLEFLDFKFTNLKEIVGHAKQGIEIPDTDMLLLAGSLVEGLGTSKSDLDLILLSKRGSADLPVKTTFNWVSGKCLVDMWVVPTEYIDDLLQRFSDWCAASWDHSDFAPFDLKERALLHRISTGLRLVEVGSDSADPFQRPAAADIARLKFQGARHEARAVQVDMAGLRDGGDFRSLAYAAVQLLGLATDALLAAHHLNNFTVKWRSRLLEQVPESWIPQVNPAFGGPAGTVIWNLQRFPDRFDAASILPFAHRIAAYARAVFVWSEQVLLWGRTPAELPAVILPPTQHGSAELLPHLDFDVDYDLSSTGIILGRLNEFGEPLVLQTAELAAVLLFDGLTPTVAADSWIAEQSDHSFDIESLVRRCADADLIDRPD